MQLHCLSIHSRRWMGPGVPLLQVTADEVHYRLCQLNRYKCPECDHVGSRPRAIRRHCLTVHGKHWIGPGVALQQVTDETTCDELHQLNMSLTGSQQLQDHHQTTSECQDKEPNGDATQNCIQPSIDTAHLSMDKRSAPVQKSECPADKVRYRRRKLNRYKCPECDYVGSRPRAIRRHCLKVHGKQLMGPGRTLLMAKPADKLLKASLTGSQQLQDHHQTAAESQDKQQSVDITPNFVRPNYVQPSMDTTPAAVKKFECSECGFAGFQPSTMRWHCLSAHGKQWMGHGVALQHVTEETTYSPVWIQHRLR